MGEPSMINTGVLKRNPFPGIRPFTSAEDKYYFGRENVTSELTELLQNNRFVALVGASGSGKTSLIQSGIIPELITQEKVEWVPVTVRPGPKPVESLIRAFQQVFPKKLKEPDVQAFLSGSQDLGNLIVEKGLGSHNYCLVIDQFEELFRFGPSGKSRVKDPNARRFVDLLVNAVKVEHPGIYVLLSVRSDFIEATAAFRTLTELMNRSKYLLPQMSREALASSIAGPVQIAGARLEAGFVDYLLDDLEDIETPLPQLQHALMRTWEAWSALGDREQAIAINEYQSVGTVRSAISDHLESIYKELDQKQKGICERLFKSITSKSDQYNGFRRQATMGNIARIAQCTFEDLTEVVEVFRQQGRAFLSPHATTTLTSESLIEISHESLIRIWDRLNQWVDEEHEAITMYLKLSQASAAYQQGRTELWRNPELQMALNWRATQKPTPAWGVQYNPAFERAMVFLSTSEEELQWEEERKVIQQKRRLMLNRSIAIFMGILVVVLSIVFYSTRNKGAGDLQTDQLAEEDYAAVNEEQEVAQIPVPENTQILEMENLEDETPSVQSDPEAVTAETATSLETEPRTSNASSSGSQLNTSTSTTSSQTTSSQRAAQQARDEQAARLEMERMSLNVAREVARQSTGVAQDPDLQGLLAYQSYLLNSRNNGNYYDVDIYKGLYAALKKLISPAYNIYPNLRNTIKDIQWLDRTGSIITASNDGTIKILSGTFADRASQISLQNTGQSNECLIVSPDERSAVVGTNGGGLLFLELENQGEVVHQNSDEGKIILFLANLGKTGNFISAGTDSRIVKWDYTSRTPSELVNTQVRTSAIAASTNGRKVAYGTRDGKLNELDVSSPDGVHQVAEFGRTYVKAIAYSPSGQNLVVGLLDGSVKVLSGGDRRVAVTLRGPESRITDLAFSPDGKFLAAASNDGKVYLWSSANWNNPPLVFDENRGFVLSVCFSGNGKHFYSGSVDYPRLIGRPSESAVMAENFCSLVGRNLTQSEWQFYFGEKIPYARSCPDRN